MRHVNWFLTLFLTLQSEFSSCGGKKSSWLPHQQLGCWLPLLVYRSHCQSEASQSLLTYRVSLLVVFVVLLNCHESIPCVSISVLAACVWQGELCWRVTEACGRQKWWLTRNVKDSLYQACPPKLQIMLCSSQSGRLEFPGIWPQNVPGAPKQNYQNPGWPTQNDISLTNAHAIKAVQTPCISRRGKEVADVIMHFVSQLLYMDPPRAYE